MKWATNRIVYKTSGVNHRLAKINPQIFPVIIIGVGKIIDSICLRTKGNLEFGFSIRRSTYGSQIGVVQRIIIKIYSIGVKPLIVKIRVEAYFFIFGKSPV